MITQAQLKSQLHYDPLTGVFTRLVSNTHSVKIGDVAGYRHSTGYIFISLDNKQYRGHLLAFLYMEGSFPAQEADHINHARDDNSWSNLRHATPKQNRKNSSMYANNKSGFCGVFWEEQRQKWRAYIKHGGSNKLLGRFASLQDAIECRKAANIKYGYHDNHGK